MNDFVKSHALVVRERTDSGWRFFIPAPGRGLVSTNDALAEKFYDGFRKARAGKGRPSSFGYNEMAGEIRGLMTLACRPVGAIQGLVDLRFIVSPNKEWDDDAWLLLVKWCIDGMTDAGLWGKDRRVVRWIAGRIERDYACPAGIIVEIVRVSS